MYKEALRNIQGLEITAVIAVVIFFSFFVGLMIYVYGYKNNFVDHMEHLPLEEKDATENNNHIKK